MLPLQITSQRPGIEERLLERSVRQGIERKRAEEALKDADTRKNELLVVLAREMGNPRTRWGTDCGLSLLASAGHDKDRQWALTIAERRVRLQALMVDDPLDSSRIKEVFYETRSPEYSDRVRGRTQISV